MSPDSQGGKGDLVDLHSHLVPAVDDGARSVDDVLEGVGRMWERGVTTIVTTPHLDASLTRKAQKLERRLSEVDEAFRTVEGRLAEEFPGLTFRRGHEVMLDLPDPDLSDPRLRLGGGDLVLVEWPRLQIPPETGRVLRALRSQGVQVLVAHAERYHGYDGEMTVVERWRGEGGMIQMNYGSLAGRYGGEVRDRSFRMLERGWVDCLATDFHGRPHLRLYLREARRIFRELEAEEAWHLLTASNPGRMLRGEELVPVPPMRGKRGVWQRLFALFR